MYSSEHRAVRYGTAVAAVLLIFFLRMALTSVIGEGAIYISTYPVIVVVALTLGLGPGLVTTVLSIAMLELSFIGSDRPFDFLVSWALHEVILLFTALCVGLIGDRLRTARAKANAQAATAQAAETALRKSEQQLRQAMRLNRSFSFEWNVATDDVVRTEECAEVMGLPVDTAIHDTGEEHFQRIHPEDRDDFISILKGLTPGNNTYTVAYRLVRHDGETIVLEETGRGVFNENGVLESLTGIAADITARKKAEEAVHRQNEILEGINGILNASLTSRNEKDLGLACLEIVEKATQSKVGFISMVGEEGLQDIAISVSGLKACRMQHKTDHRTRPSRLNIHGVLGRVVVEGKSFFTNEPAHHTNGIMLPAGHLPLLSFLGVPLIREGRITGMIAVGNREGGYTRYQLEIVEALAPSIIQVFMRKRTEDALRQSREYLARAQQIGEIGNWRLDVTRNILIWSDESYRIFGVPPGTPMTYETFLERVHPDDRQYVDDQWKKGLTGAHYDIEHRIVAGGETKWVRELAYLEFDETDSLYGAFGITQDITQRKRAEAALRHSRDRFALVADTMETLLQTNEPKQLAEALCIRVMEHLDCQVFFNYLADESTGRLHLNAYAGIPEKDAAAIEWLDYGVAVCGCVAAEGCPIVAEHIPATPDPRTELVRSFGIRAYACHPLPGPGNNIIGTLSFGSRNRETFDDDDLALMKNVTDHLAIALQRVNSERALQHAHDKLELRVEERTAELRQASLYARSLIETSIDPLILISPEGEIMDVNHATERATGVVRDKLIGSEFSSYFTEPEQAREAYRRVLKDGQMTDYPLTIRHTSGTTINVLCNTVAYRNEAGIMQGIFAAARDVTRRIKVEQALRQSEARLSEAQRIAHLGGWDWDIVGNELDWSDEMFRIFGFPPQSFAVTYETFLNCIHPEDRQHVNNCVKQALYREDDYDLEYRIVLPDKQERVVRVQGEVLRNTFSEPVRMIGTALDITGQVRAREEAKAQQQQLIQADKMASLGILVSGIAHEINNPNHSIMSNITALSGVWESVEPILDKFYNEFGDFVLGGFEYSECRSKMPGMFANALTSSRRIEAIVKELRDFSRFSPNEKMMAMDINAVLKSAVILLSNMIEKATDRLVIEYGAQLPPVLGNFQRIEQVLINLIQNACRALPSRDRGIFISTWYSPELQAVQFMVRDEGVGIPEKNMKHLGDPFFTTNRAAGGTGLGLWVSLNIVQEHGGTLTFHPNKGEGVLAILTLPIQRNKGFVEMEQQPGRKQYDARSFT